MPNSGNLIKFEGVRLDFPSSCPVCGKPVTSQGVIPAISILERRKAVSPEIEVGPYGAHSSPRLMPQPGSISRLFVPTCDEHAFTLEETARYRGPLAVISGLMILLAVALTIWIVLGYAAYTPVDASFSVLLGIVVLIGIGSYYASGPTPLERAISVVDLSPGMTMVVLKIKDNQYARELLRLNKNSAKRVRRRHIFS